MDWVLYGCRRAVLWIEEGHEFEQCCGLIIIQVTSCTRYREVVKCIIQM